MGIGVCVHSLHDEWVGLSPQHLGRTVHHWAKTEVIVPSVSAERVKLWSYSDLFALRIVHWLRRQKATEAGHVIPPTAMKEVRRALAELNALDLDLLHEGRSSVLVSTNGQVYLHPPGATPHEVGGQAALPGVLDLVAPFETPEQTRGVDLVRPSAFVRIVPRRLAGAPHVVGTRIDTESLAALARRGFDTARIVELYPDLTAEQVRDALDVEVKLAENLAA